MFEEAQVCMVCGRPVDSDGQVYCGDECSALDISTSSGLTSPSLSATSSAYTSPYLTSTADSADVPALVPSALGSSHRHKHSISSSSNSSVGWSTTEDLTDNLIHIHDPTLTPADPFTESTKNSQYLHPLHAHTNMMQYARRPSTTNNRSTVPLLLKPSSGIATPAPSSASSYGAGKSMPSPYYAAQSSVDGDDASSLCLSEEGDRRSYISSSTTPEQARRKRNRASLPAYFSLLQRGPTATSSSLSTSSPKAGVPSSSSSSRHWRTPSALAQLSRSLQLASPTTPRVSHATVSANTSDFSHANSPTSVKTEREVLDGGFESFGKRGRVERVDQETRGRGRATTRDPNVRSTSGRRGHRSPVSRQQFDRRPFEREVERERGRARMSAAQRARIDSVEKVAEWVSSSPVISGGPATRPTQLAMTSSYASCNQNQRRNSSPEARRVKYEFVEALTRGLKGCAVESDEEEEKVDEKDDRVRGRRRPHELDVPTSEHAPGLGNGRSGLKARESHGRIPVAAGAGRW